MMLQLLDTSAEPSPEPASIPDRARVRALLNAYCDFMRDHFPGVPADLDLSPSFGSIL